MEIKHSLRQSLEILERAKSPRELEQSRRIKWENARSEIYGGWEGCLLDAIDKILASTLSDT